MYICICNALSDKRVRQAIDNGARTPVEVYRALGGRPQCGQCALAIQEILHHDRSLPLASAVRLEAATSS